MDKSLLDPPDSSDKGGVVERPAPSPMPPPSTPDNSQSSEKAPSTPKNEQGSVSFSLIFLIHSEFKSLCCNFLDLSDNKPETTTTSATSLNETVHDDDDQQAPSLVVYLVEPFTLGTDDYDLHRFSCLALLRCYQTILSAVPDHIRTNINVQVCTLFLFNYESGHFQLNWHPFSSNKTQQHKTVRV